MNRTEFINKLNSRLELLKESERNDIIDEYLTHIDLKIKDGKTEAEAIADFGNLDELAQEILEAYHIDNSSIKTKNLEYYIKEIVSFINIATEKFLSLSGKQIATIIVEFFLVMVVIALISIPLDILGNIITSPFYALPSAFRSPVVMIINLMTVIAKLAIAFLIVYGFINKRIISLPTQPNSPKMPRTEGYTSHKAQETSNMNNQYSYDVNVDTNWQSCNNFDPFTGERLNNQPTYPQRDENRGTAGDFVINLVVIILKAFAFVSIWIPSAIITITGIVCTVIAAILLITKGIGFIGLCVIGLGCCIIGIAFTAWLSDVIFGGKKKDA